VSIDTKFLNERLAVGPKVAPNRLVNQPMECNDADPNGDPSELTRKRYRMLAEGRAGIIHIESASIMPGSLARKNQLLFGPKNRAGLSRLVEEMKSINDKSLIITQLNHSGAVSEPFSEVVSYYPVANREVRILTDQDIEEIRDHFIESAKLSHSIGADGIDLKMCHGYLGGQLLRPANTKDGRYGGSFENRSRFFREVAEGIRTELSDKDFVLGTRFSFYEAIPGGFGTGGPTEVVEDPAEPLAFCRLAEELGFHFLNVSGGIPVMTAEVTRPTKGYPQGVYRQFGWAARVKEAVGLPVIGSAYSYLRDGRANLAGTDGEKRSLLYWACNNIAEGRADMVGIGRQSLADPLFAKKALAGDLKEIRYCLACGGCSSLLVNQGRVGCSAHDPFYKEELREVRKRMKG